MRLKLKENPREWRKFTVVWTFAPAILIGILYWRGKIDSVKIPLIILPLFFLAGMCLPRAMRIPYRAVMTISFHIGQVIGRILLTLFFLLALTPLALLLRLLGKDLLQTKKDARHSYWEKAPAASSHERMF